ncbi:MAG: lactate utilization protein [Planctomycetaceae bacterium]|jgi:L-lactate dehydrogenase complex protein LldF|nr:lactate utilization protein [Planctomycetaceae bacterium]
MSAHSRLAKCFLADEARTDWHNQTLWIVRQKRDKMAASVPNWEQLRETASAVKEHTLAHLDTYLEEFEQKASANGVNVLWANDAAEFNGIMLGIIRKHNAKHIVKSKSMLTEECGMNHFLADNGIEVVDTDLGERIIQFRGEMPSHVVLPAIHLKKEEIGETFHQKLGTKKGASDPVYLTKAARTHLREKFLAADLAITGVNFAVAETGGVTVCTNEGNADMGVQSASVQVHCVGIEKLIPKQNDLGLFTRLLARSATGQPVTTYTSHYLKPKPDGTMYIIIVDNGRSQRLGNADYVKSLKCLRCGACMNTCPVYRRSGGHSYGYLIPGPIGAVLAPHTDARRYNGLPFASSLCGSCNNVCPAKVDIKEQIYRWRQDLSQRHLTPLSKRLMMFGAALVLSHNRLYNAAGALARWGLRWMPRFVVYFPLNVWGKGRENPLPPPESFKQWYRKHRQGNHNG